jgi:NitT/TauT family transport system substrate-binding protein
MKIKALIVFLITMLLLTACKLFSHPQPQLPPLKFAYSAWAGYFPIVIAQEKGFFSAQGVKVEASLQENSQGILADFGAGKYDGILASLGEIIPISATNPNLRLILVTAMSVGADAVVAQPEIQTIVDLKGKTIGVGVGSFGELFVTKMLEMNQVSPEQVTFVNVSGEQIPERLKRKMIQAGHSWEPYVSNVVKAGVGKVLFTSKQTPTLMPDVLTFTSKTLRERPQEIRAFVRAWFQAVDYWQTHLKEGNAIISKVLNIAPETISLEGVKFLSLSDNRQELIPSNRTNSLYYTAQLYSNFYVRSGNLTRPPDLKKFFDPSFLQ